MIHDEVSRQMRNYLHDTNRKEEVEEDIPIDKRKDDEANYIKKNKDTTTQPNKNSDESGSDNSFDKNDNKIDVDKVTIDGNEKEHPRHYKHFPITKPDADDTENIAKTLKLQTVYGNSVGNEQVTNIFIMYPKDNLSSLISVLKPKDKTNEHKLIESQSNFEVTALKEIELHSNDLEKTSTNDNLQKNDTPHKSDQSSEITAIKTQENNILFNSEHDNDKKILEDAEKIASQEKNVHEKDSNLSKLESETVNIKMTTYSDQIDKQSTTNNEKDEESNLENQTVNNPIDTEKHDNDSKEPIETSLDKNEVKETVPEGNENKEQQSKKDVEESDKDIIELKSTEQGSLESNVGNGDKNLGDAVETDEQGKGD